MPRSAASISLRSALRANANRVSKGTPGAICSRKMHLHAGEWGKAVQQSQNADDREVAFEQRVRRLRRRMCDERNLVRRDIAAREQRLNTCDDPRRHALGRIMRGRHLDASDNGARLRIDRDDIRERAADIYTQTQSSTGLGTRRV